MRSKQDYLLFQQLIQMMPRQGVPGDTERFIHEMIAQKGFSYEPIDMHHIGSEGPGIVVANHPIGLIDGILLFDLLSTKLGRKVAFIGSSMALTFDPDQKYIIPVHHHKDHAAMYASVQDKLQAGYDVVIFPAGDVMYFRPESETYTEKDWRWTPLLWSSAFAVPLYPIHIETTFPPRAPTAFCRI